MDLGSHFGLLNGEAAVSVQSPGSVGRAPKHRFSLVACARWEEDAIVEWIEYHRAIGVGHFYIYSNDDHPGTLLKILMPYLLQDEPIVTYRHWPEPGQQPQIYFHFLDNFLDETEWFSFLDIDEFLVFKNDRSVSDFIAQFETGHDAIYLNWLIYGNNFRVERDNDSVLLSYTRRAAFIDPHTKTLTRAAAVDPFAVRARFLAGAIGFWHFWNEYDFDIARLTNVLGGSVAGYTDNFPAAAMAAVSAAGVSDAMIATAYVAHFQFKSERDFIRRGARGGFEIARDWEAAYASGSYKAILNRLNVVYDSHLAGFWAKRVGRVHDTRVLDRLDVADLANVALRKPSRQSSIFPAEEEATGRRTHGHGNDGFLTGGYGFHTALEDGPWWSVDLLDDHVVHEIHLYNRIDAPDVADRAFAIAIEFSEDGTVWDEVYLHDPAVRFSGARGSGPLRVQFLPARTTRFVRIISRRRTLLHLDEVEVYGRPARGCAGANGIVALSGAAG